MPASMCSNIAHVDFHRLLKVICYQFYTLQAATRLLRMHNKLDILPTSIDLHQACSIDSFFS